jgi:integrase
LEKLKDLHFLTYSLQGNAMKRKLANPVWPRIITQGNASTKIYKVSNKGRTAYTVAHKGLDGRRKLRQFANEADAVAAATRTAQLLHEGELRALTLRDKDAATYLAALDAIKPTGFPLDVAAREFAYIHKMTAGRVTEAAEAFHRSRLRLDRKTTGEALEALLQSVEGRSERHRETLRKTLRKFVARFPGHIDTITAPEIETWIEGLYSNERTRHGLRGSVVTLFRFARRRGFLPDEITQAERARTYSGQSTGEIGIFTPIELARLLHGCRADVLPYVLLGAFAGLRTEEIKRLRWEDIKTDQGHIELGKSKTKTRTRRIVPILPALKDWLALYERCEGLVIRLARPEKTAATIIGARAGVPWKHNGLRHSFASYRMAMTKNESQVASEMGNTPSMIYRNYRALVTEQQASAWFSMNRQKVDDLAAADFVDAALDNVISIRSAL